MLPKISVVTPCYNGSAYIAECIKSVQNQTFCDWEMLIIDDCSMDSSVKIIKKYADCDNRIRYFQTDKPSGSPTLPRNIGIDNARGEYIAFLDCDDLWLPDKLESQIEFAEVNHYSFVYSNYEKVTCDGVRSNRVITMSSYADYKHMLRSCEIPCLTAFIRKDCIGELRFMSMPKEDYIFWLQLLKKPLVAYNTQSILALYRMSTGSRSSDKWIMLKEQWNILRQIEQVNVVCGIYYIFIYGLKGIRKYLR